MPEPFVEDPLGVLHIVELVSVEVGLVAGVSISAKNFNPPPPELDLSVFEKFYNYIHKYSKFSQKPRKPNGNLAPK